MVSTGRWGLLFLMVLAYPARAVDTSTLPPSFDPHAWAQRAQALTQTPQVPALGLAIVHRGQVRVAQTWGTTSRGPGGTPAHAHTVFRLASLSKGLTSAAAGLAVQDGVLRWDSRAQDWIAHGTLATPAASQALTLADLLSQQTGVRDSYYGDLLLQKGSDKTALDGLVARAPLKCSPGQCYSYQNVAYQWAGDMVAHATGQPLERYVGGRLFIPLGMTDASYGLGSLERSPSWARPHVGGKHGATPVAPKPNYYLLPAAAGANGSIHDLAHWLAAQGGHRTHVLPMNLLDTLHAPRTTVPPFTSGWRRENILAQWYGLGWRVWNYRGHRVITHAGAVQGYRGVVALLPEKDLGIAMLWNSQSTAPAKLLPEILDAALAPLGPLQPPADTPAGQEPSAD